MGKATRSYGWLDLNFGLGLWTSRPSRKTEVGCVSGRREVDRGPVFLFVGVGRFFFFRNVTTLLLRYVSSSPTNSGNPPANINNSLSNWSKLRLVLFKRESAPPSPNMLNNSSKKKPWWKDEDLQKHCMISAGILFKNSFWPFFRVSHRFGWFLVQVWNT